MRVERGLLCTTGFTCAKEHCWSLWNSIAEPRQLQLITLSTGGIEGHLAFNRCSVANADHAQVH